MRRPGPKGAGVNTRDAHPGARKRRAALPRGWVAAAKAGIRQKAAPVGYGAAALDVHQHALVLNLAPVGHLVRLLHVVLVLILDEGIAARLAWTERESRRCFEPVAGPLSALLRLPSLTP